MTPQNLHNACGDETRVGHFSRSLHVQRLGLVDYGVMHARQQACHAAVAQGLEPDTLFLLQHPQVVTTGRAAGTQHVQVSLETLQERGIGFYQTGRGGDVTYHAPGQLVCYPILQLQTPEQDLKAYVWRLEEIVLRVVADFGVQACRVEGLRGLWVGEAKLAAIGVRIAQWTTLHGFALNVHTDLQGFSVIVPCGLHGRTVTSLQALLGPKTPSLVEVEERVVVHAGYVLQRHIIESQ